MTCRLCALLLLLLTALPARAADLSIFAAASLTEVTQALKTDFEKTHPDLTLTITNAASGDLLRRMETGAAADVLLSADTATMDAAVAKQQVLADSLTPFAGNVLVMAVPAGNPARIDGLEDLTRGGVRRIGVGNPESVPAGRYAKRALHEKALWFALTSKLVYYPSVRHVLSALANQQVDAGFIYRTDAVLTGQAVAIVATIPLKPPVTYVAARATTSHTPKDAAAFVAYLTSTEARSILGRFGFAVP